MALEILKSEEKEEKFAIPKPIFIRETALKKLILSDYISQAHSLKIVVTAPRLKAGKTQVAVNPESAN